MASLSPQSSPMPPPQAPSPMGPPQTSPSPSAMIPPPSGQNLMQPQHPHSPSTYPQGPPHGMINHMNGSNGPSTPVAALSSPAYPPHTSGTMTGPHSSNPVNGPPHLSAPVSGPPHPPQANLVFNRIL